MMRRAAWLVVVVACGGNVATPRTETLADSIIATSIATYAHAYAYRDHGIERDVVADAQPSASTVTFETAFVRGHGFHFTFLDDGDRARAYVIDHDASGTRTRWWATGDTVETSPSLALALAAATGVSKGTAYEVPSLLAIMDAPPAFAELRGLDVESVDLVDGHPCWRIAGTQHRRGTPDIDTRLWIDQRDHVVRKQITRSLLTNNTFVFGTTTYAPTLVPGALARR